MRCFGGFEIWTNLETRPHSNPTGTFLHSPPVPHTASSKTTLVAGRSRTIGIDAASLSDAFVICSLVPVTHTHICKHVHSNIHPSFPRSLRPAVSLSRVRERTLTHRLPRSFFLCLFFSSLPFPLSSIRSRTLSVHMGLCKAIGNIHGS